MNGGITMTTSTKLACEVARQRRWDRILSNITTLIQGVSDFQDLVIEWRDVTDYPGYEISNSGRVRSYLRANGRGKLCPIPHLLKRRTSSAGYNTVDLYQRGISARHHVGPLVLTTFVGPRPPGMEACHNNSVPTDDRIGNLRWDTHTSNMRDKLSLTDEQVLDMRILRANGERLVDLAKTFECCPKLVGRICRGDAYRTTTPGPFTRNGIVNPGVVPSVVNVTHRGIVNPGVVNPTHRGIVNDKPGCVS